MVNRMTDYMNLTLEQQEAICEIDHNLQIIACAGRGVFSSAGSSGVSGGRSLNLRY